MDSLDQPMQTRSGFSLIEILVVISIVAILSSLLITSIQTVKQTANQVKCSSNQRQLGLGIMAYAGDNSGRLPCAFYGPGPSAAQYGSPWFDSGYSPVFAYLNDWTEQQASASATWNATVASWYQGKGINGCPAHVEEVIIPGPVTRRYYSYIINSEILGRDPTKLPCRISQIGQVSTKVLLIDAAAPNPLWGWVDFVAASWGSPASRGGFIHRGRLGAVFFDGHVESRASVATAEIVR